MSIKWPTYDDEDVGIDDAERAIRRTSKQDAENEAKWRAMEEASEDLEDEEQLVPLGIVLEEVAGVREIARAAAIDAQAREISSPMFVLDAERALIGAALLEAQSCVEQAEAVGLQVRDFYDRRHGQIWQVIVELVGAHKPSGPVEVAEELARQAKLHLIGGTAVLARHMHSAAIPALAGHHAQQILDKAAGRSIQEVCGRALVRSRLGENTANIVDEALVALTGIGPTGGKAGQVNIRSAIKQAMDALPANGGKPIGVSVGFPDVDFFFRAGPGDLIVIAARPAMGKTAFALDIVRSFLHRRERVHLFSLEMSGAQLVGRMIAAESGCPARSPKLSSHDMGKLFIASGFIDMAPFSIDETAGISIGEIKARARQEARRSPPSLIVVDYIQLVTASRQSDNRAQEVGEVSAGLKALGRELGCPVIALSQLNRSVETRTDRRPGLADLRESGSIEQDADVVGFLYREEYYAKDRCPPDQIGVAEFIIGKNRNGPTGVATLHFNPELPRFDSLARV